MNCPVDIMLLPPEFAVAAPLNVKIPWLGAYCCDQVSFWPVSGSDTAKTLFSVLKAIF